MKRNENDGSGEKYKKTSRHFLKAIPSEKFLALLDFYYFSDDLNVFLKGSYKFLMSFFSYENVEKVKNIVHLTLILQIMISHRVKLPFHRL